MLFDENKKQAISVGLLTLFVLRVAAPHLLIRFIEGSALQTQSQKMNAKDQCRRNGNLNSQIRHQLMGVELPLICLMGVMQYGVSRIAKRSKDQLVSLDFDRAGILTACLAIGAQVCAKKQLNHEIDRVGHWSTSIASMLPFFGCSLASLAVNLYQGCASSWLEKANLIGQKIGLPSVLLISTIGMLTHTTASCHTEDEMRSGIELGLSLVDFAFIVLLSGTAFIGWAKQKHVSNTVKQQDDIEIQREGCSSKLMRGLTLFSHTCVKASVSTIKAVAELVRCS